mgnify:CR=1 FL=1
MLGEVALVPKESPINQSGLMFFNTLFDENACCHVAAGAGFSEVLDGFMDMSDEEILAKGINDSLIHVDFMVGSDDLHIVGIHEDGSETDVFVNGTWLSNLNNHRPILSITLQNTTAAIVLAAVAASAGPTIAVGWTLPY